MRRLLTLLIVLGVLGGLGYAASIPARSWWKGRSAVKYLTAPVSRGRVETLVNSTGTIKAVRTVAVGAFISGPVKEVYAEFNSRVKKDQVLALIDPRLLEAARDRDEAFLETQRAELARIEAQLNQAKNNEDRAKKLSAVNPDYLSQMEMDQYYFTRQTYDAQKRLAHASIRQAEATLKNSLQNLDYTRIKAPDDGVVVERKIDPGQTVAASFQTPELFTLALELDRHVYIYVSVDEADVGLIRRAEERERAFGALGALLSPPIADGPAAVAARLTADLVAAGEFARPAVKFTVDAYPGELFPGRIFQIRMNSTTTQNVVTYPVVIEAANPGQKLMPGMTANVTFQVDSREDALRVPSAALRYLPPAAQVRPEDRHYLETVPTTPTDSAGPQKKSAGEKADLAKKRQRRLVWVKDGELLRAVPVVLGLIENQYAELVEGDLTEGQALITGTEAAFGSR